ncbi:MAG TPA: phosphotransferase family protein [Candidatus Acidoferrum sp.]|nr:phosphotransferase family protein [Candidatus Acidoferrum sp.]
MAGLEDQTTAVRPGEELDLAKLEPFLRAHFPSESGSLIVRQYPSGHSNLTYSLQLGSREMVLRRPPFGSKVKTAHDMSREFRVLSKLHAHYPPAPRVLIFCDDESVLGTPFYLMEPIHGVILRREVPPGLHFSPAVARRVCESFLDNLALLHGLDYSAVGLADLGKPQGYLERQVRGWIERYHGSKTHEIPEIEALSNWIQQRMPASGAAALIHNDYKYDNVVLDPNDLARIIGVLDWEMCTIGDPLTDLGSALAYWVDASDPPEILETRWGPTTYPGSLSRAELVQRYAQKTGRDASEMAFYLVFARFKIAVIVQQIYYRYHQGLTHDERFASMPDRIKLLLQAALRTAETGAI